jgi:hypothetical protein
MTDNFLTFPQASERVQSFSAPVVQPQAPAPTHQRDDSSASSSYSQTRMSTFDTYQAYQNRVDRTMSVASSDTYISSSTNGSHGPSIMLNQGERQSGDSEAHFSALRKPNSRLSQVLNAQDTSWLSITPNGEEQGLGEFYDTSLRYSQPHPIQAGHGKRVVGRHSTIIEVDTPLASPMFPKATQQTTPGAAF